ncbi:MAG: HAMP domain-containing histidine kinase [Kurthia sp.]|nr:HAMP domain-containing histidine kinase [Candidatus Kurthia equi]
MDKFKKIFVSLAATIFLIAGVLYIAEHDTYNKSFTETGQFKDKLIDFKTQLNYYELNVLSEEQAIKSIKVTSQEIKDYRNQYGSLKDQVTSIEDQYSGEIAEARDVKAKKVEKKLISERDKKINDITRNFEDENYVKEKIIKEKTIILKKYYADIESNIKSLHQQYPYFAYSLTNLRTGVNEKGGDLQNANFFKVNYNSAKYGAFYDINSSDDLAYVLQNSQDYSDYERVIDDDIPTTNDKYIGSISISDEAVKGTEIEMMSNRFEFVKKALYTLWIVGIALGIVGAITLWRNCKSYKISILPIEIQVASIIFALIFGFSLTLIISESFESTISNGIMYDIEYFIILCTLPFGIWLLMAWAIRFFMSAIQLVKDRQKLWESSLCKKTIAVMKDLTLKMSLTVKVILYLIIIFLAGFGFLFTLQFIQSAFIPIFYIFLFIIFVIPTTIFFFKDLGQLNKIMKSTENIVKYDSDEKVPLSRYSEFNGHATYINQLKEGFDNSQVEQNKSERLKTELVTNVSHDLRTPLTSIITYTELLKKENLTEAERAQYVDVLDKKSQRLKTLIDDLFEVSKMTSGNVEIQKQDVDITQLLQQALGEYEEEIEKSGVRFQVAIPEAEITAHIDGQKYWRVLDNLISNAIKYAMDGTRVFVTLEDVGSSVQITIKNISKYEISEAVEELYERFKRADASRHTEGSGLGLAIAQSIVEIHGGQMNIAIDGDLFKVVVTQPKK